MMASSLGFAFSNIDLSLAQEAVWIRRVVSESSCRSEKIERGVALNMFSRCCGLMLALAAIIGLCTAQGSSKPNILFILVDDLGYNDLSLHGSPYLKTPNIDRIARSGVQFTTAYSLAAQCSPARAGFLTGKNPATFGHVYNPPHTHEDAGAGLPLSQTIIPQVLKRAGYATSIVGKWHLGFHAAQHPIARGFNQFFGFLGGAFPYFETRRFYAIFRLWEYIYDRYNNPQPTKHLTIRFTDEAIDFISASNRASKPFFLYLSYNAPHGPLDTLPQDIDKTIPAERRPYAAMITRLDKEIGRLMQHLDSLGISDNTLVVFTNDNGGLLKNKASNFPFRGRKGNFLEGGIRIPMFMQWKGHIRPGQTISNPVTLMDMFPTFQEIARVPNAIKRTDLQGVNLMPYIPKVGGGSSYRTAPPHNHIVLGVADEGMVRRGPFKLWMKSIRDNDYRLYNTDDDPEEKKNIGYRHRDVERQLLTIFNNWNSRNPAPAFQEELRPNPISITFQELRGPFRVNSPINLRSTASHAHGRSLSYQWEVFRPQWVHMADFLQVTNRQAPFSATRTRNTTIRFNQVGRWTIRINASHGPFMKWAERNITVVA